jgi:hypothetical protein
MPRQRHPATAAAALVSALGVASLLLAACGDDGGATRPADSGGALDVGFDVPADASNDADTDGDGDGGAGDASGDLTGCQPDRLEPTSYNRPVLVDRAMSWDDLTICGFDDDWFRIAIAGGQRLEARLTAPYAAGDLDLLLFDTELTLLASSSTTTDEEHLAWGTSEDQTVMLRVFGVNRAENTYSLSLTFSSFGGECADDAEEPNDSPAAAFELGHGAELEARICRNDVDWYRITLAAGDSLSIRLDFRHALGDLDMRLFLDGALDMPLAESRGETDVERIEAGPFEAATTLLLEVYGFRGALNDYRLQVRNLPPPDTEIAVSGVVRYQDRPFNGQGFTGELVDLPARGLRVELVRAVDGVPIVATGAGADGAYTLGAAAHADHEYYVRAVTALAEQGFAARVIDRTADAHYAVASAPFLAGPTAEHTVDLRAAADLPAGGAFNILDVVWSGFDFVGRYTDEIGSPLTYRWEPGRAFGCGSCYSNNVVSLGGQLEDADEYDDDIVLHEFGHYFQDNYSNDDSPGGRHNGERLDPRLAYGEGMATFFSCMVQDDPEYVDLYIDSLRLRNLETAAEDPEQFYGTDGGTLSGNVSEYLVAAVMWDTIDPSSDEEPFDRLERDPADVMAVFLDYMRRPGRTNVGARGIDLADWINGLTCLYPDTAEPLADVLAEREYPWDAEQHAVCASKANDALPVSLVRQGPALFLTSLPGAAELVVRIDDGQGWQLEPVTCPAGDCRLPVEAEEGRAVVVTGHSAAGPIRTSWLGDDALRRLLGVYREGWSEVGRVKEWRSR